MADLNLSISDAIRTVEHSPHTLSDASLQVSLFEEFEDENPDDFDENTVGEDSLVDEDDIIIIVSGILPSTSKDAIENYFENSRRSGGGEVSNFHYTDDGEAIISFSEVKGMCDSYSCLSFKSTRAARYALWKEIKESAHLVEKISKKWRLKIVSALVNQFIEVWLVW